MSLSSAEHLHHRLQEPSLKACIAQQFVTYLQHQVIVIHDCSVLYLPIWKIVIIKGLLRRSVWTHKFSRNDDDEVWFAAFIAALHHIGRTQFNHRVCYSVTLPSGKKSHNKYPFVVAHYYYYHYYLLLLHLPRSTHAVLFLEAHLLPKHVIVAAVMENGLSIKNSREWICCVIMIISTDIITCCMHMRKMGYIPKLNLCVGFTNCSQQLVLWSKHNQQFWHGIIQRIENKMETWCIQ